MIHIDRPSYEPAAIQHRTTDGVIGTEDAHTVVWSVTLNADTGAAATLTVHDGDANTDTTVLTMDVPAGETTTVAYPKGAELTTGCYVDIGGASATVSVTYSQ